LFLIIIFNFASKAGRVTIRCKRYHTTQSVH
jgi:hypothetical protein